MSCCQAIQGRAKYNGGEPSSEGTCQIARGCVCHKAICQNDLLVLVVWCQLCTIDNAVTHAVGAPRCPQTFYSLELNNLAVTVNSSIIIHFVKVGFCRSSLILEAHFNNVCWVCNRYANSTGDCSWHHFLNKSWIFSFRKISRDKVPHWHIHSNPYPWENELSL